MDTSPINTLKTLDIPTDAHHTPFHRISSKTWELSLSRPACISYYNLLDRIDTNVTC
jgi:hypothetical protein